MMNKKVKNVFDIAKVLYDEGFTKICMVVGSDRVREFDILLNKYNGKKAALDRDWETLRRIILLQYQIRS